MDLKGNDYLLHTDLTSIPICVVALFNPLNWIKVNFILNSNRRGATTLSFIVISFIYVNKILFSTLQYYSNSIICKLQCACDFIFPSFRGRPVRIRDFNDVFATAPLCTYFLCTDMTLLAHSIWKNKTNGNGKTGNKYYKILKKIRVKHLDLS